MAKLKKDKSKGFLYKLKTMDGLSKCFLGGFVVAITLMVGVTIQYVYVNEQAYLRDLEYEDPSANFIVVPPSGWSASTPDRSKVESVIQETTKGGIFDVTKYTLTEEIVPVVLLEDATSSTEKGVSGSSYISVALRGYDTSNDRLYDKGFCEDYLGGLLELLEVEDIKYTNAETLTKGNFNGTLVQAEAKDNDVKVYYTQYQEIVGSNVLTLTFGTTKSDMDSKEYLSDTLKHLKFKILGEEEFVLDVLNTELDKNITSTTNSDENKENDNKNTSDAKKDNTTKNETTSKDDDESKDK